MILDIALDSLELSGEVTTSLLGGSESIRWTKQGSDDCFLTVDADALLSMGGILQDESGSPLSGKIIVRGGLRVREGTATTVFDDGWQLLQHFDGNRDGQIDASDSLWNTLDLFMDTNADGLMVAEELHRPETSLRSMQVSGGAPYADPVGNTRSDAMFTDPMGATGVMSDVAFALLATAAPAARGSLQLDAVPNPFNPLTRVRFGITSAAELRVRVYDTSGRFVLTLSEGRFAAGSHRVTWSGVDATGSPVASGIYFVRLETSTESLTRKVTLAR